MQEIFLSLQCWIVALLDFIHQKSCLVFWQALCCGLVSLALWGKVIAGGVLFGFSLWSRGWFVKRDFTITSSQRLVRGRLEVINSVALEGNADFATSKSFGERLGQARYRMSQWNKRMCHWGSLQIFPSLGVPLTTVLPHKLFASQLLCSGLLKPWCFLSSWVGCWCCWNFCEVNRYMK